MGARGCESGVPSKDEARVLRANRLRAKHQRILTGGRLTQNSVETFRLVAFFKRVEWGVRGKAVM